MRPMRRAGALSCPRRIRIDPGARARLRRRECPASAQFLGRRVRAAKQRDQREQSATLPAALHHLAEFRRPPTPAGSNALRLAHRRGSLRSQAVGMYDGGPSGNLPRNRANPNFASRRVAQRRLVVQTIRPIMIVVVRRQGTGYPQSEYLVSATPSPAKPHEQGNLAHDRKAAWPYQPPIDGPLCSS